MTTQHEEQVPADVRVVEPAPPIAEDGVLTELRGRCWYHDDRPSDRHCRSCGRPLCVECTAASACCTQPQPWASVYQRGLAHLYDVVTFAVLAGIGVLLLQLLHLKLLAMAGGLLLPVALQLRSLERSGQTLGQHGAQIRFVSEQLTRVSVARVALFRAPLALLLNVTGLALVDIIVMVVSDGQRSLKDRITGIRVVTEAQSDHLYPSPRPPRRDRRARRPA